MCTCFIAFLPLLPPKVLVIFRIILIFLQAHHDVFRQMVDLIGITSIMEVSGVVFHSSICHNVCMIVI